jgi:hypothetical protein
MFTYLKTKIYVKDNAYIVYALCSVFFSALAVLMSYGFI